MLLNELLSSQLLRCLLFFFQAEDGIRDLVRSRGLGDVYKRQSCDSANAHSIGHVLCAVSEERLARAAHRLRGHGPVSYTHLTLPTSDLV